CAGAIPSGIASLPCAHTSTRMAASPTTGPIASWDRPVASGAPHAGSRPRPSGARTGERHGPEQQLARLERATVGLQAPFALVDLDALQANAADMERRAAPKPIRLASKSVRCRALQERILARPGFRGTLAYTLPEALWLASRGAGDLLVAYPTADRDALRTLSAAGAVDGEARSPQAARVSVMVDSVEQLEMIDEA